MIASIYSIPLRLQYVTRGGNFYVEGETSAQEHSRWSRMIQMIFTGISGHGLMLDTLPDVLFAL